MSLYNTSHINYNHEKYESLDNQSISLVILRIIVHLPEAIDSLHVNTCIHIRVDNNLKYAEIPIIYSSNNISLSFAKKTKQEKTE